MELQANRIYLIRKGNKINQSGFDFDKLYTDYEDTEDEVQLLKDRYPQRTGYYQIYTLDEAINILVSEKTTEAITNTRKGVYEK
jgi:predicted DNA binding CopG/RHH family protein